MSIRELFDHQVFNAALDSPFELFGFHGSGLLDGQCSVSAALETGAAENKMERGVKGY
jgi:hypothetical protein